MHLKLLCVALAVALSLAGVVCAEPPSVSERTRDMDSRVLFEAVADTLDTRTFTPANATASTADFAWTADILYAVDNVFHTKAAGSADLSALGDWPVQSNATSRRYVFHLDGAGQVNATVGPEAGAAEDPVWPVLEESLSPFAAALVTTSASSQFTLGTTSFGAVGVNATFSDLSALPSQALQR